MVDLDIEKFSDSASVDSQDRRPGVKRLSNTPDALGESPVWDSSAQCLWWIDGVAGLIRRLKWHNGEPASQDQIALNAHVGAIALAENGRLIAALEHSIVLVDPVDGSVTNLMVLENPDPAMRLNDAKADRQGRFVCAGMGKDATARGMLHQLDRAGRHQILATGLTIGNGICFSPDGRKLYFSDTPKQQIYACDYEPDAGRCGPPIVLIDTSPLGSGVDGATVDRDGYIWAALVRVGKIARIDPNGQLIECIDAPTDLPSSLAFGGPDMATMFVTSIRDSGTGRAISSHPDGGHLYAIEGLGAKGIQETRFGAAR